MMAAHNVVHRIAIGDDVAVESPILAQMLLEQHEFAQAGVPSMAL